MNASGRRGKRGSILASTHWGGNAPSAPLQAHRTEEHPAEHGPADYVLHLKDSPVAVVEAKKLTVGPQNVLTFDSIPVLHRLGECGAANRAFDGQLEPLLVQINEAIAA